MLRMYVKDGCSDCARAREIIAAAGLACEEIEITINPPHSPRVLDLLGFGWNMKFPFLMFTIEEPSDTNLGVLCKLISIINGL